MTDKLNINQLPQRDVPRFVGFDEQGKAGAMLFVPSGYSVLMVERESVNILPGAGMWLEFIQDQGVRMLTRATQGEDVPISGKMFVVLDSELDPEVYPGYRQLYNLADYKTMLGIGAALTFASAAEVLGASETTKAVNSSVLSAIWKQGSDVASAATITLGDGGYAHITGTTTITDIDWTDTAAGRPTILVFDGVLTLTHNATNLILPTGANITTAAGDSCLVVSEGGDVARVVWYQRASGQMLLASPNFTSVELGAGQTDTTLSRDSAGVIAIEGVPLFSNIPQNSQSAAYTLVLGDAQKQIYHPSSDNNARTFTIPANSSVAYPIGTVLTFINEINTVTIAITSDTLVLAGPGSTGSRTLAANGMATAVKVTSTRWYISGAGLT